MNGEEENDNSNNQIYSNSFNNLNHMHNYIKEEDELNHEMENSNEEVQNLNIEYEQDDVYMMELQKRLQMMKQDRKLAEKDSQLLFNRLRLLKNEEEKVNNFLNENYRNKY